MATGSSPRFLPLAEVSEVLSISAAQVYALVRRGELRAIKIGGRGQWRVEGTELEAYIERMYKSTRDFISDHPYVGDTNADDLLADDTGQSAAASDTNEHAVD